MTERWLPPTLARGLPDTGAWNAVVALGGQAIGLGAGVATLRYRLGEPATVDGRAAIVASPSSGARFLVAVREFPFEALYGVRLAASDLPALPAGLRQALMEGMLASAATLAGLGDMSGLRILDGGADGFAEGNGDALQWFDVRLELPGGAEIALDIAGSRRDAAALAAWLASRHAPVREALESAVAVPADFSLGAATMAARYLHALEPGAVVVMAARPDGQCSVRVADRRFLFERGEDGWRCIATDEADRALPRLAANRTDGDTPMEDEPDNATDNGGDAPAVGIGDLSVAVEFDIGRAMVPLSELSRWQPGTVADLDPPQAGDGLEVTIRAGGEAIGSGDIVRIDDRIGVRITRLFLRR